MRHFTVVLIGTFAAIFSCEQASAQDQNRFDVGLTGRVLYDSNVARSDKATAAIRGIELEDEIFSPNISLDVLRRIAGQSVFLRGSVGYDLYQRNDVLNRERFDLHTGFTSQFGPCSATPAANYVRFQSDLSDLTFVTTKNTETTKSVGLDATCARPTGFVPTLSLLQVWDGNSAALQLSSNYNMFSGTAGLGYNFPALGEISLYGQYQKTRFPRRAVLIGSELIEDGYEVTSGGLRYKRKFGATLDASVSSGYTSLDPAIPTSKGFEGLSYQADILYHPTSALQAHFVFERAPKPSNRLDVTFSKEESYLLAVDYTFSTRWTVELGGSRIRQQFQGIALKPALDLQHEAADAVFGFVRFALTNRLSLTLDSRWTDRDANLLQYSYGDLQVGLSATTTF